MLYMQEVVEMPEVQYKVDLPAFTGRNVPIKEIAQDVYKRQIVSRQIQERMPGNLRQVAGEKAGEIQWNRK